MLLADRKYKLSLESPPEGWVVTNSHKEKIPALEAKITKMDKRDKKL